MSSNEIKFEHIERYLAGRMTDEELQTFESELQNNETLRQEVLLHKQIAEATLERNVMDFRASVQSVIHEKANRNAGKFPAFKYYIRIAAAISIIFLISYTVHQFYFDRSSSLELFMSYFVPYDDLITGRSDDNNEENLTLAMMHYNQGEHQQAISYFRLFDDGNKPLINLYLGICYLSLEDFELAHKTFENGLAKDNPFTIELKWYQALTYLREENSVKAKLILEDILETKDLSGYRKKATELLKEL